MIHLAFHPDLSSRELSIVNIPTSMAKIQRQSYVWDGMLWVKFGLKHVPKWQNSVVPEIFKNGAYLSDLRLFGKSMYQINFQLIYYN
jgi:hypothetical protein